MYTYTIEISLENPLIALSDVEVEFQKALETFNSISRNATNRKQITKVTKLDDRNSQITLESALRLDYPTRALRVLSSELAKEAPSVVYCKRVLRMNVAKQQIAQDDNSLMASMNLGEKILLKDNKSVVFPHTSAEDSFELLMKSFQFFLDPGQEGCKREYEEREFAKGIYSVLGWEEDKHFDVISSFYTLFKYALVFCDALAPDKKPPTSYSLNEKGNFCYTTNYGKTLIGKKAHITKILDKNNQTIHEAVGIFKNSAPIGNYFIEFSGLCHCVANFMPCPADNYNEAKGFTQAVKDYLPLMINKIQKCIDNNDKWEYEAKNKPKRIPKETIVEWHTWFIKNREKYCLEPYYYIEERRDTNKSRIIGIPLFRKQSLENPDPSSQDEVIECVQEIIKRILSRANLILQHYHTKSEALDNY